MGGARATGLFTDTLVARGPVPGAGAPAKGDAFALQGSLGGVALGGALQAGTTYPADAIAIDALPAPTPLYAVFGTLFGGASDVEIQGANPGYDTGTIGGAGVQGGAFEVRPFAGLDALGASYGRFIERAPGMLNLAVAGDTVSTGFARAGVRLAGTMTIGGAVASPSVMAGYERAFGDLDAATSSSLATSGGTFNDRIASIDESSLLAGASLSFGTDRIVGHVGYEGAFGSNNERHRGSIGLSVRSMDRDRARGGRPTALPYSKLGRL